MYNLALCRVCSELRYAASAMRMRGAHISGKAGHGCDEADVGVAPDVDHVVPRVGAALELQLIVLQNWKQLHGVDSQLNKVGYLQGWLPGA